MDGQQAIGNRVEADVETSAYVPSLQLTEGQPPPIAANGGLSYMSFDRDGDAGTGAALEAALQQIAEGHSQALIDRLDNAPPGPIETKWGPGFREYEECLDYIRANGFEVPEGGRGASPALHRLRASVLFHRAVQCAMAGHGEQGRGGRVAQGRGRASGTAASTSRKCCAMRAGSANTIRASRPAARKAWTGSAFRWRHLESRCENFY